ncbi:MAG: DUF1501 domain-containing protein [Planctomycetales bacterium]|nr:DUF1501 domain-containing protein [Planctomycetales bacterium]
MPTVPSTRRAFLRMLLGEAGGAPRRDVLVVVYLRGGADGLTLVPPHVEAEYHRQRPQLALARPDHASVTATDRVRDLDGRFGLAPALDPILPLYREGLLGVVHAVGSEDQTRSHFEAQDLMEHGVPAAGGGTGGGWLGRHLRARPGPQPTALSAVAIGPSVPEALRGAPAASAVESLDDYRVAGESGARLLPALALLHEGGDPIGAAGRETIEVVKTVERLRGEKYVPGNGATYPGTAYARALQEIARLIRADVGLEAACVDIGGWDTHFFQGNLTGAMSGRMAELAGGVAAFAKDLTDRMDRVTLVAMTEFGRRVAENSSFGTDHGRASVMFLLGGAIAGGKVHGTWPGLSPDRLADRGGEPGDLAVTTDYRDVLSEVLARRCGQERLAAVFPGHEAKFIGVTRG